MRISSFPKHRRAAKKRTGHEGRGLETLILSSLTDVRLTKIPLAARRMAGGALIACCGPVDFMGGHIPTGRLLIFDAKQSQNLHRLPISTEKLREHQRLEICRYGESGFVAGLLCECSATNRLYWCDWRQIERRRPSIAWREMSDIGSSKMAVNWCRVIMASDAAQRRGETK